MKTPIDILVQRAQVSTHLRMYECTISVWLWVWWVWCVGQAEALAKQRADEYRVRMKNEATLDHYCAQNVARNVSVQICPVISTNYMYTFTYT